MERRRDEMIISNIFRLRGRSAQAVQPGIDGSGRDGRGPAFDQRVDGGRLRDALWSLSDARSRGEAQCPRRAFAKLNIVFSIYCCKTRTTKECWFVP